MYSVRVKTCGIYGLWCKVSKKWYVGQSVEIEDRLRDYKRIKCSGQKKLYYAFKKYGWDAFESIVLEVCEPIDAVLDEREIYWIAELDGYTQGYNLTTGGGGTRGHVWSAEQKAAVGKVSKARWNSMTPTEKRLIVEKTKISLKKAWAMKNDEQRILFGQKQKDSWNAKSSEEQIEFKKCISSTKKKAWLNKSPEERDAIIKISKVNIKKALEHRPTSEQISTGVKKYWLSRTPIERIEITKNKAIKAKITRSKNHPPRSAEDAKIARHKAFTKYNRKRAAAKKLLIINNLGAGLDKC